MSIRTLIATLTLLAAGATFAQTSAPSTTPAPKNPTATPKIDKHQTNQQKRIDQGVASGSLNEKEAARLQKREDKIAAEKEAAKADGKVTKGERRKIKAHQANTSRAIAREKHDRQHAK